MRCKYCDSERLIIRARKKRKVQLQCRSCRKYQSVSDHSFTRGKVLLLDIETLYMEVTGIWKLATDYIQPDRIKRDWSILCYAAKWLFEPEIMGEVVTPQEAINRDEKSIIEGLWKLLDQAAIVVTQNGINFDLRSINAKFLKHGLPPPSKYMNVDTKVVVKNVFRFPSNKLDYLGKELLGLDGKMEMTIEDWDRCAEGDVEALHKMITYCKMDVAPLLEDLYILLRPWVPNHPNLNLFSVDDAEVCPRCGGKLDIDGSVYPTPTGLWKGFRCKECGGIGRLSGKENKIKSVKTRL